MGIALSPEKRVGSRAGFLDAGYSVASTSHGNDEVAGRFGGGTGIGVITKGIRPEAACRVAQHHGSEE